MNSYAYILWIPLLPLAGFVLLGLFGKKYLKVGSGLIGTLLLLGSTVISLIAAASYFFTDGSPDGFYQKIIPFQYTWLSFTNSLSIDMTVVIDPISVMMLVIVSFVSLMVHVFSMGYMKGEKRYATYYAWLSLFTFSMLGLVLSGNLFQVYIFWELVGVSSFLLIGFYFDKPSAVAAAKKAFIITRFADLGFLIGILVLGFYGNTLDIPTLLAQLSSTRSDTYLAMSSAGFLGISVLTWGLLLVFIGGAGKSAMFPLHVWLPDAMEGPTPVSALIHAATMVVAGVYLVARLFPAFSLDAAVMQVITWTGMVSALLAALIACTQTDIKRVLAYSTMSQIGYMMLSLGVSGSTGEQGLGYTAAMFHLFTHALFKSLLFLSAGAVIHYVHSNDMRDMGGLRKQMPLTNFAFLVGCFSIAGIPVFSGFFSKEQILLAVFHQNRLLYAMALFTAALTAFYMFRLYFSVFWHKEPVHHPGHHEGTVPMKIPLVVLSFCSIFLGMIPFSKWITPDGVPSGNELHIGFSTPPVMLSLGAALLAMYWYRTRTAVPGRIAAGFGKLYRVVTSRFYIDEVYLFLTKRIIFPLIGAPAAWIDRHVVDGAINGIGKITAKLSAGIKGWQSGKIQSYALYFLGGIMVFAVIFIYVKK